MSEFIQTLSLIHVIRPAWLVLIPITLILWWIIRTRLVARLEMPKSVAPHLATALTVGADGKRRWQPIDLVAVCVVLIVLATAGIAWNRVPNPLVAQTAPLAIALSVAESMEARDIAPSRIERAKHKVLDILSTRAGGRTALIAYAGTAHRVAPLTEDPDVLKPFIEGLSPAVMPRDGNDATAALEIAKAALSSEPTPGAILFVSDQIDRADLPAFRAHLDAGGAPVVTLIVTKDTAAVDDLNGVSGLTAVTLTADGSDVATIERRLASAFRSALAADERQQWDDKGWLFAWPAAMLLLFWFRRGWTMRWAIVLGAALSQMPNQTARADGLIDWFFTPDQQGRLAYDDKRYGAAADAFEDPSWQGFALYRGGKYEAAAEVFARLDTAEAAIAQGMAHMKSRGYRDGIRAFETALERDPDNAIAKRNLEVARVILDYVERAREQSDTGEESGIGADDVVFDNEAARGTETQTTEVKEVQPQTADQWMRTVDTQMADFLRSRFTLEAARGATPENQQ